MMKKERSKEERTKEKERKQREEKKRKERGKSPNTGIKPAAHITSCMYYIPTEYI